jgi:hypothetical protein
MERKIIIVIIVVVIVLLIKPLFFLKQCKICKHSNFPLIRNILQINIPLKKKKKKKKTQKIIQKKKLEQSGEELTFKQQRLLIELQNEIDFSEMPRIIGEPEAAEEEEEEEEEHCGDR